MIFAMTSGLLEDLITALFQENAVFDPANLFVGLYTDGPSTTPPTLLSDFTFPAVAAFGRRGIATWTDIDLQPDGSYQIVGETVLDFHFTTFTEATNFIGAYIATSATVGDLVAWGEFDNFIQFLTSTAHARFVPRLTITADMQLRLDMLRVDDTF